MFKNVVTGYRLKRCRQRPKTKDPESGQLSPLLRPGFVQNTARLVVDKHKPYISEGPFHCLTVPGLKSPPQ
jgi:hypothetical protein